VIEAVIFDWGGTLTPWTTVDHLAGRRRLADVLHADDPGTAEVLAAALLAADDARWRTVRDEHRAFTLAHVLADAAAGADPCVWTSELPWTEPHPTAFRTAMAAVGVTDPSRCVYVGDRPYDDISGAKGVGMRAVLVPHSEVPAVQQVPVDVRPDAVIQGLGDLPELLAGW
jgi:putative hydrolase of the HAD superfamily